jgi:glycosyltransferase involved in cell wall biosynthesis
MRLLILSQYYPPESGAPQNRLSGLALQLVKAGHSVEVLTAMPNYPEMKIRSAYSGKVFFKEVIDGIPVQRAWIYASANRSIISRLLNYFSFVFTSVLAALKIRGRFDYVMCESPPLFLGMSAVTIARMKKAKLIFNVSDLWPESAEKLGIVTNKTILGLSYRLEKWLYKKSSLITGQTQGICENIIARFPDRKVHWLPNGIDAGKFDPNVKSNWLSENNFSAEDFILMYGGILGHAQGLEVIISAAEKLKAETKIKFVLVGDGPEKVKLMEMVRSAGLSNVFFTGLIPREDMSKVLLASDAAIIPLRKLDLFKGAIPSKIFENLAMKKPVLLGVEGEAKKLFVEQGKCSLFFEPENANALHDAILSIYRNQELRTELGTNGANFVAEKFDRKKITLDFLKALDLY